MIDLPTIKRLTGLLETLDGDGNEAPLAGIFNFTIEAHNVLQEAGLAWSDLVAVLRVGAARANQTTRLLGRWPPATWNGAEARRPAPRSAETRFQIGYRTTPSPGFDGGAPCTVRANY